jgi:hypothetical protein
LAFGATRPDGGTGGLEISGIVESQQPACSSRSALPDRRFHNFHTGSLLFRGDQDQRALDEMQNTRED